jgi:hypothetical protein
VQVCPGNSQFTGRIHGARTRVQEVNRHKASETLLGEVSKSEHFTNNVSGRMTLVAMRLALRTRPLKGYQPSFVHWQMFPRELDAPLQRTRAERFLSDRHCLRRGTVLLDEAAMYSIWNFSDAGGEFRTEGEQS